MGFSSLWFSLYLQNYAAFLSISLWQTAIGVWIILEKWKVISSCETLFVQSRSNVPYVRADKYFQDISCRICYKIEKFDMYSLTTFFFLSIFLLILFWFSALYIDVELRCVTITSSLSLVWCNFWTFLETGFSICWQCASNNS